MAPRKSPSRPAPGRAPRKAAAKAKAPRKARAPRKTGTESGEIDAYLSRLSGERLEALLRLRKTIRSLLPRAEECISYGLPAFRVDGEVVAGFAATSKGCSYYPFSSATLVTLAPALARYTKTKGALQFDAKEPLPMALVRRLLKTRIAERAHR